MNRAINTLKARIEKIEERMKETQKIVDEPEMMSDYEFAINDLGNYKLEIMELQKAIQILSSN
jgi:hypothetical protein